MSPSASNDPATVTTSDATLSPRPSKEEHVEQQNQQVDEETLKTIHQLLARQLEYYFSTANLEKDTYLSTLRSLNDGYVPLSIIANFGKVQALAPHPAALEAVQTAATDFSELLEIVVIDSHTGKRLLGDSASEKKPKTVIAVGPVAGAPIPMERISTSHGGTAGVASTVSTPVVAKQVVTTTRTSTNNGVQNTIILRETPEGITEDAIRDLFAYEGCPSIESVKMDLNFWFVTLDTSSRDAVVDVMFKLRTQKFPSGEPVKARLKSLAAPSVSPSPVNFVPVQNQFDPQQVMNMYAPSLLPNSQQNGNTAGNGSKKKRSNKNRSNKGKNQQQQQPSASGNNNKSQGNKTNQAMQNGKNDKAQKAKSEEKRQEPPTMGEKDFPSLPPVDENSNKKIEVEKVPDQRSDVDEDEFDKNRNGAGFSDSSSTATTSTASTPNPAQPYVVGGYAAALLKAAAPQPMVKKMVATSSSTNTKQTKNTKGKQNKTESVSKSTKKQAEEESHPAVNVQPPSWGKGRSFADIVSTQQ